MSKTFNTLRKKMSPKAKKQAQEKTQRMLAEMPLQALRQAKELSQEYVADKLKTQQANVSRIERRADMYISTLRNFIEAMGGKLDIIARFPEGNVRINQFRDVIKGRKLT